MERTDFSDSQTEALTGILAALEANVKTGFEKVHTRFDNIEADTKAGFDNTKADIAEIKVEVAKTQSQLEGRVTQKDWRELRNELHIGQ